MADGRIPELLPYHATSRINCGTAIPTMDSSFWGDTVSSAYCPIIQVERVSSKVEATFGHITVRSRVTDVSAFVRNIEAEMRLAMSEACLQNHVWLCLSGDSWNVFMQMPKMEIDSESTTAAGVADDVMRLIREKLGEEHCRLMGLSEEEWRTLSEAGVAPAEPEWDAMWASESEYFEGMSLKVHRTMWGKRVQSVQFHMTDANRALTARQTLDLGWDLYLLREAWEKERLEPGDADRRKILEDYEKIVMDKQYALLSDHVYEVDTPCPAGWLRVTDEADLAEYGLKIGDLRIEETNFRAELYVPDPKIFGNYPAKPVLVFKGTDMFSLSDWVNNGLQGRGKPSEYYAQVQTIAKKLSTTKKGREVVFAGHSLGGGLASYAALCTGRTAVTINAAGLHDVTLAGVTAPAKLAELAELTELGSPERNLYVEHPYGHTRERIIKLKKIKRRKKELLAEISSKAVKTREGLLESVTAYRVKGEILTPAQEEGLIHKALPDAVGTPVVLPSDYQFLRIPYHSMEQSLLSIETVRAEREQQLIEAYQLRTP